MIGMDRIHRITDLKAEELHMYTSLSEVQLMRYAEPDPGFFIAESPKVIIRALDAGYAPVSMLIEDKHLETEAKEILVRCPKVPVYTAGFEVLKELTGFALTRGMLCLMRRKKLPDIEEICADKKRIVILDDVENPTNVGAIFRSAAALHMDAVLLTKGCADPLYRRALRVSMGNVFRIPWTFLPGKMSLSQDGFSILRKLGYQTAALALSENTISIEDERLLACDKLALILGNEGEGLPEDVMENTDFCVKIPMTEGVDSLNVAAASAVAFWQIRCR